MPGWFKVPPLGSYNPDWIVSVIQSPSATPRFDLMRETAQPLVRRQPKFVEKRAVALSRRIEQAVKRNNFNVGFEVIVVAKIALAVTRDPEPQHFAASLDRLREIAYCVTESGNLVWGRDGPPARCGGFTSTNTFKVAKCLFNWILFFTSCRIISHWALDLNDDNRRRRQPVAVGHKYWFVKYIE
ncbi:hypothetical protein [Burkholderia pseudomultivorans]|uniref:restriction endonuclease n=1 Tax=Burkholderia pseudomultivorans TaxID=1207504 RepID=UPI001E62C1E2|nr:hypothetical protein [Burkholderia pseudomultivorans]